METKDITPIQYAKWYGCSLANITKHLRKGNSLPYVITIKRWSRFYLLEVPKSLNAKSFSEIKTNGIQPIMRKLSKIAT
jgi:hypothetical protein